MESIDRWVHQLHKIPHSMRQLVLNWPLSPMSYQKTKTSVVDNQSPRKKIDVYWHLKILGRYMPYRRVLSIVTLNFESKVKIEVQTHCWHLHSLGNQCENNYWPPITTCKKCLRYMPCIYNLFNLTLTFNSKTISLIQNFSRHLHTSDKYCVKYENTFVKFALQSIQPGAEVIKLFHA